MTNLSIRLLIRPVAYAVAALMASGSFAQAQVPELTPVPMLPTGGGVSIPDVGGVESSLSWSEERQFGDQIAYQIQQDLAYERDTLLHDYVSHIWMRLLQAARQDGELNPDLYRQMAWKMFLVRDPTVNAFALPGAYIGVNLGLIAVVKSQDELASVLAHESVHIFQRHIARMYGRSSDATLLSIASMIAGAIVASANPNAGAAIFMSGPALIVQDQINFTRAMEYEADRIGYKVLVDAGFRPQGMADMFQILSTAMRYSDTTNYPYLRTHPLDSQRIAEAQTRIGIEIRDREIPVDVLQGMMSARARVLSRSSQSDALQQMMGRGSVMVLQGQRADTYAGDLYAGVLASAKLRQFNEASQMLEVLLAQVQGDEQAMRVVQLLGVEIALLEGDAAKALAWLGEADIPSGSMFERTERLIRAQVAVASGQPVRAIELLQPWVVAHADDDSAWGILAQAYRLNQQMALSLRAEGEVRMVVGDFNGAIDRFRVARSHNEGTNIYDLELIQSRLKAAEQELQNQMELSRR